MSPVNPQMLIQMIQNGGNPQQLVMSILKNQMGNNPIGQNLISMVEQGNTQGIEQFARNVAKQRGIDFDKEFSGFRKTLGL